MNGATRGFPWSLAMRSLESSKSLVPRSPTCRGAIVWVSVTSRRLVSVVPSASRASEQFCPRQKVIAVDRYGGLAEHIVVDGRFAFRLPPQLDSTKSAPLLSSGLTVYAGILRARLLDGSRVAVLGVGGLGHLAIQFLHAMGHRVTAFSHSRDKRDLIERLGGAFADSSDTKSMTGQHGAFDLRPVDVECRFQPRLICENAETTRPALPGGVAAGTAVVERWTVEQFWAIGLWQLHR